MSPPSGTPEGVSLRLSRRQGPGTRHARPEDRAARGSLAWATSDEDVRGLTAPGLRWARCLGVPDDGFTLSGRVVPRLWQFEGENAAIRPSFLDTRAVS